VLAEAITADMDQPPFHRAAMDGVALRAGSVNHDLQQARLTSQRVRAAGDTWVASDDETCCEIMTGAALPDGFDTVIPYEDLREISSAITSADVSPSAIRHFSLRAEAHVRPGQNVHRRASDYRAGDLLIEPPWRIRGADVHTLVSTGRRQVVVRKRVSVGILATGSEILDPDGPGRQSVGPSSIRASNHLAIAAELAAAGWTKSEAICCEDIEERIEARIADLLRKHDVVLVTGGVSKGRFDFVPRILEKLGIVTHAHGVALKPGKPLLIGTFTRPEKPSTVPVFGLPGNPVSCLVTMRRFVLPLLRRWEGCPEKSLFLPWQGTEPEQTKLTHFLVVRASANNGSLQLKRLPPAGSGSFHQLVGSHGIAELPPAGEAVARHGDGRMLLRFWPWSGTLDWLTEENAQ
jgi:molybdopterin molybdotransferase